MESNYYDAKKEYEKLWENPLLIGGINYNGREIRYLIFEKPKGEYKVW